MHPLEELIELLSKDRVIPVIGAGVSYAVAGLPGWSGTVANGLDYAAVRHLIGSVQLEEAKILLAAGSVTDAANLMKETLNAPGHPFAEWLSGLFGDPAIQSPRLLHAINDLCAPIVLTTNYDPLLYATNAFLSKKIYSWLDYEQVARAQNNKDEFYLHLHGIHNRPESIILCSADYQRLASELGYKRILERLWTDYHFLFIGCSHNGVLDEDFSTVFNFLNEWFPGVPNKHFALLLESDLTEDIPKQLMKNANVTSISYGKEYGDLVTFIERINPNRQKALQQIDEMKKNLDLEFQRRAELLPGAKGAIPEQIGVFLSENVAPQTSSLSGPRFEEIKKLFDKYNHSVKNKRQSFANYLQFVQGMIDVNDLKGKIAYWQTNRDKPAYLNNHAFINTAVVAYQCLQAFPDDLLEEIRHREPYAIHDYYFTGYLGSFINEYTYARESKGQEAFTVFENDEYFFENLKRILDSLRGILSLKPEDVFQDTSPALINAKDRFELLFIGKKSISLRMAAYPYPLVAELHADENLPFRDAELVVHAGKELIIGHTSKSCFLWNPREDYYAYPFFNAPSNTAISKIVNLITGDCLINYIFCGGYRYTFSDFVQTDKVRFGMRHYDWTYLETMDKTFALRETATTEFGPIIEEVKSDGTTIPWFSKSELWDLSKGFFQINTDFELQRPRLSIIPHFQGIQLNKNNWKGKEVIVLRAMLHLSKRYSVFVILDWSDEHLSVLTTIIIPDTICFAYDIFSHDSNVDIVFGYASTGTHFRLLNYLANIDKASQWLVQKKGDVIDAIMANAEDIFAVNYMSPHRVFALQQGNKVYEINLSDLSYNTFEAVDTIKIVNLNPEI